ncbi:unnamed protein product [Adineta ricciae]|uniref:Voltage-gated hydrogen channel 1 n=1 Tax=Adineta ricciae TaxID=249248 RepID=A0A814QKQ0_ADIRI|nr:unnamed protein product [Adineta ricciae]CAF1121450.1 unnamed protein product [Adineta ricciae]
MKLDESTIYVAPTPFADSSAHVEDVPNTYENEVTSAKPISKWAKVRTLNRQIVPRTSQGEIKLNSIIDELKRISLEEREPSQDEQALITTPLGSLRAFRRRITNYLQQPTFHYIVILLVVTDLIVVLVDLVLAQLSSPCLTDEEMKEYNITEQRDTCLLEHSDSLVRADLFLFYFSVLLLTLFVAEVFISFYGFGWRYFQNPLYLLDGLIVCASFVMELYFHYGQIGRAGRAAAAIVILRLWKIVRAIHAVAHSITLKNRLLMKKIQEAKDILLEEKQQTQQAMEKQEIQIQYYTDILTSLGKLPTTKQLDKHISHILEEKNKPV